MVLLVTFYVFYNPEWIPHTRGTSFEKIKPTKFRKVTSSESKNVKKRGFERKF